jgi:methionine synthase II (cobalamin-independent)
MFFSYNVFPCKDIDSKNTRKESDFMSTHFQANCLPVLIGSLPIDDHAEAVRLVFEHTPDIPLWIQLPVFNEEGMIRQFLPGMPGVSMKKDKRVVDATKESFDRDILEFYEEYMAVIEGRKELQETRFVLTADTAPGFFKFTDHLKDLPGAPLAVKGQITGPITFCTATSDQNDRAIFYDDQLRDAAVKLLALKARWQVQQLSSFNRPVIIFFDEPALAGFGSSEFISITREAVKNCLEEVFEAVHMEGGLAGIHVCANTDWSLLLESSVDIVNFDAYAYFDRFILYPDQIKRFMASGRTLAWGMIPTLNREDIENATTDALVNRWEDRARKIEALGIDYSKIMAQALITPSCGSGSLSLDLSQKVLRLTKDVSRQLRNQL